MKVVDYEDEIKESEEELRKLEKQQSQAKLLRRVQFLRLLKSGEFKQAKRCAEFLGLQEKQGYEWWKLYRNKGLGEYLKLNYKDNARKLKAEEEAKLLEKTGHGFGSQKEVREYILQEFGVEYTQQGISDLFKRLKIKKKVVRPFNIKANQEEQVEYKKTSHSNIRQKSIIFTMR